MVFDEELAPRAKRAPKQIVMTPVPLAQFEHRVYELRSECEAMWNWNRAMLSPEHVHTRIERVVDGHGVEHVSITVPWPGRADAIIGFRGVVCPACGEARMQGHSSFECPLLPCTCISAAAQIIDIPG